MSRIKNTIKLLNILSLRSVVGISELSDMISNQFMDQVGD